MSIIVRFIMLGVLLTSCTENGLFDDTVNIDQRLKVSGRVSLNDSDNHAGVYIYLEGFDISSQSDAQGRFTLEIPVNPRSQPGGGISGAFYIWYYLDDYTTERSLTIVKDGQFQYGKGDIDDKGNITATVRLLRLLDVQMHVFPENISLGSDEQVTVSLAVQNTADSVELNAYLGKRYELGALFIRNEDDGSVRPMRFSWAKNTRLVIDSLETWTMITPPDSLAEKAGDYSLIPYIKLKHDLPPELIRRFGLNAANFTLQYLSIPSRLPSAALTVDP